MTENLENEVENTEELPQEPAAPAVTHEMMQELVDTIATLKDEVAGLRKPAEPVAEPTAMPTEYDPAMLDRLITERAQAILNPIAEQTRANEVEMIVQFRDRLIGQIEGLDDESRSALQAMAQRQFESGAADNMEEAINNAMLILAPKTPKLNASQDARRKGRRGAVGRAPEDMAELDEDSHLDAIFAKHNI